MNNSEALDVSLCVEAAPGQLYDSDQACGEHREAGVPAVRLPLSLIWSNICEIVGGHIDSNLGTVGKCSPLPLSVPAPGGRFDWGLWLLDDALIRREVWSRLSEEPVAAPLPRQASARNAYCAAKRICDVAGSLILLTLLLPVLVLVAALVRLDSPGPALFRQRRIGKDGREFLLWKFRSMRTDTPKYAPSPTNTLDWRLTRIGRLIRRVSIDELPQLINVLRGEMSLVGPRPEMPFIVNRYTSLERRRLVVKPGITGLWQISPARAYPIHENLQYDLHYIREQNLMLDGAILFRTIAAVVRGVGAV